jgi:hypothetical protein
MYIRPSPIPPLKRLFLGLAPQFMGFVLAGAVLLLGRWIGEGFLDRQLGLKPLATLFYLLLTGGAIYLGERGVWKVENRDDNSAPWFDFVIVALPFLFLFIYIIFYAVS